MDSFNTASMCDVIDITLYKFNYYDNLIWTKCLNQLDYSNVNEDSILVTPYQLRLLLDLNFKRELMKISAIALELIHRDANSIYFLNKILTDFDRLKYIKLTFSKSRYFSRMVQIDDDTQIKYSFKILRATLRLNQILSFDQIKAINPVLKELNIIKDKQYSRGSAGDLLRLFERALNTMDITDEQVDILAVLMDVLSYKLETDNPEILLVTDW